MVAGNDDLGTGNAFEEGPRGQELPSPGPLGEIAAHGDQRRFEFPKVSQELSDERGVFSSEVKIRDVGKCPHSSFPLKRGSQAVQFVV